MTNRVINISDNGAYVHYGNELLHIDINHDSKHTVPVRDIAVLMLSNPAISITQLAISAIIENGGMVVTCNQKYLPVGMFLPVGVHSTAARNYEAQIYATEPMKKQIWKQIITKKIAFQSQTLNYIKGNDHGLKNLCKKVQSGDTGNVEGYAARLYWQRLFDQEFNRNPDAIDQNRFLNYGYTVMRACAARALCSSGLHPSFGVHHHNQYDAFRLADDIMEPFRPMVDLKVVEILKNNDPYTEMNKDIKRILLSVLNDTVKLKKKSYTPFEALTACSSSLLEVFERKKKKVVLPDSLNI